MRRPARRLFAVCSAARPRAAWVRATWCAGAVVSAAAMAFSYTREEYDRYHVGGHRFDRPNVSLAEGRLAVLEPGGSTQMFYERAVVRVPGLFVGTRHPMVSVDPFDTESGGDVHLAWPLAVCTAGLVAPVARRRRDVVPGRCPECGTAAAANEKAPAAPSG